MMKRILTFGLIVGALVMASCDRKFDEPPGRELGPGTTISLSDVRNMHVPGSSYKFGADTSFYAVVIADETSGNLYKEVYISDGTAAINMRLLASGGLYEGDSIRVYLEGTVLSEYNGMLQLDSVDVDVNVIKQSTGAYIAPMVTTVDNIGPSKQAHLIKLEDVEFAPGSQGMTYADAVNQQSRNLDITDCNGNTVLMRTSGYANFAADIVPSGNGDMLAIVGQFGSDIQLYIRRPSELNFVNPACGGVPPGTYLYKDWEDQDLTSGGWETKLVTGTLNWEASDLGAGTWYAKMSNYNGSTNETNESWLISPAMDLSAATNPELNFQTAYNYSGPTLQILISTDYDGISNPATQGTWTPLSATLSPGSWTWTPSGAINLASYTGNSSVYIGFKYTGTSSTGSTWEVDDVVVAEN